jgi:hypothetical protein
MTFAFFATVPVGNSGSPAAPLPIQDTRVSSQQVDVTLAANLNLGSVFTGSASASDVGYWLDAMAYTDQFEPAAPGPNGLVLGNRFGYGLRVLFRVRQLSGKATVNYSLLGATLDAGFAQATYEIDAFGFGAQANQALASILDGVASSGPSLTGDTFYQLNSSILKNLVAYIQANQAAMQPVRVATLLTDTLSNNSLDTSHAVLFAVRQIRAGKTLQDALGSAGDLDSTAIRMAYQSILSDASPTAVPSNSEQNAADQWLADN